MRAEMAAAAINGTIVAVGGLGASSAGTEARMLEV